MARANPSGRTSSDDNTRIASSCPEYLSQQKLSIPPCFPELVLVDVHNFSLQSTRHNIPVPSGFSDELLNCEETVSDKPKYNPGPYF